MRIRRETKIKAAYVRGYRQAARENGVKDLVFIDCPFDILDDPGIGTTEAFDLGRAHGRFLGAL